VALTDIMTARRKAQLGTPRNAVSRAQRGKRSKGKLILAIDVGTTRVAVAWSLVDHDNMMYPPSQYGPKPSEVTTVTDWTGNLGKNDNFDVDDPFPTVDLYYESLDDLPITGHILETSLRGVMPFDPNRYFHLWKILFHDRKNPTTSTIQNRLLTQLSLLDNKTPSALFKDFVKILYRQLIIEHDDSLPHLRTYINGLVEDFDDLDLEIVVTVPPGRSSLDHYLVKNAFCQSGIKSSQIFLVSEPHALFRWWVNRQQDRPWKVRQAALLSQFTLTSDCRCRKGRSTSFLMPVVEQE